MRPFAQMNAPRRTDRREVSIPATVRASGKTYRDTVSNVSPTGLYLEAEGNVLRIGERVSISFSLPIGDRVVPIDVDARVARVVKDATKRTKGLGVELIKPKDSVLRAFEEYMEQRNLSTAARAEAYPDGDGPAQVGLRPRANAPEPVRAKSARKSYDFPAAAPDLPDSPDDPPTDPQAIVPPGEEEESP